MGQFEFEDITEKIKYNLVFNLFVFFFVGMLASALFLIFSKEILISPNFLGLALFGLSIVLLKTTKKYKLVAIISTSLGLVLISYIFLYLRASQYLTPLWMIMNIVFSFFLVSRFWGGMMLVIHFGIYAYFTINVTPARLVIPSQFSFYDTISFLIQLSVVSLSLGYILFEYVRAIRLNEEQLQLANSQLKEKNNLISQQNSEMEVMLREIHHRVKNNLQIISSMLRLQSDRLGDKGQETYREAIDRISAMAMIHDKMYRSDSLSMFDLQKYIQNLSENLIGNYALEPIPKLNLEVNVGALHSKTIVPLAILLNELLLNSIKHAFAHQKNPVITIQLNKSEESCKFLFVFNDNGEWKKNSEAAFGTEIIQAMVEQLDGEMDFITTESGTFYSFKLKYLE